MKKNHLNLMHLSIALVTTIASIAIMSCGDKTDPTPKKSASQLICAGAWEIASLPIEPPLDLGGGTKLADYTQMLQDCEKDDYWTFNTNKTYVRHNNLLKCKPGDLDTTMGVWKLSTDEKIFTLDADVAKLVLIDDNNMQFRVDSFLQNSSMTFKFRKR